MACLLNEDGTYSTVFPEEDGDDTSPIWLRPADRPESYPASPPKSVLLDTMNYIDDERNDTTADYDAKDGKPIQVTFWMYHPPLVSYFTVHCPGLKPDAFPEMPNILATDGDLALLRLPSGPVNPLSDTPPDRFFIYQIGSSTGLKKPSLRLLPDPDKLIFSDDDVGLLSCGTGHHKASRSFFVAAFSRAPLLSPGSSVKFYIYLFDSKTWQWITKRVFADSPHACHYRFTNKVITIGGENGSIAWVDLSHGILIHDVLLGNTILRHIPLPLSELPNPRINSVRDIAAVNGCLKYVSMSYPGIIERGTSYYFGNWKVDGWKMTMYPSGIWQWQEDYHLRASEIAIDDPSHLELLPDHLPHDFDKKLVLTRLHAGSPAVSLQDDDTVYIMTKVDFSDHKSWVLAVNTSTKALQGLAEFCAERCVGFNYTYTQSGISKHTGIELNALPHQHPQALWNLIPFLGKKGGPPVPNAIARGVAVEPNLFEALT